jgi:hypothetical protein
LAGEANQRPCSSKLSKIHSTQSLSRVPRLDRRWLGAKTAFPTLEVESDTQNELQPTSPQPVRRQQPATACQPIFLAQPQSSPGMHPKDARGSTSKRARGPVRGAPTGSLSRAVHHIFFQFAAVAKPKLETPLSLPPLLVFLSLASLSSLLILLASWVKSSAFDVFWLFFLARDLAFLPPLCLALGRFSCLPPPLSPPENKTHRHIHRCALLLPPCSEVATPPQRP